jgi:hypothetical protein
MIILFRKNRLSIQNSIYLLCPFQFITNPDIFKALLQQQRRVDTTPFENACLPGRQDLQLGNPDADLQIMVACNPYCGPCANAHLIIDELLDENDSPKVQIIFTASDDEKDCKAKSVKHLMALYDKMTGGKCKKRWMTGISLIKRITKYLQINTV